MKTTLEQLDEMEFTNKALESHKNSMNRMIENIQFNINSHINDAKELMKEMKENEKKIFMRQLKQEIDLALLDIIKSIN